jgi:hypothetical protein
LWLLAVGLYGVLIQVASTPSCEMADLWTDAECTARAVVTYGLDRVAVRSPLVVGCTP